MASPCYYVNVWGQAFGYTQVLPSLITLALSVLSRVTSESIYVVYGLFLQGTQFVVWAFQAYFQCVRPDPICQQYQTYAFPSVESYYAASLVAFLVAYSYAYGAEISVISWLLIYFVGVAPPLVLVWFSFNVWWEVLFSLLLGALFTSLFVLVMTLYVAPLMPWMLNMAPLTWFDFRDHYFSSLADRTLQLELWRTFCDIEDVCDRALQ